MLYKYKAIVYTTYTKFQIQCHIKSPHHISQITKFLKVVAKILLFIPVGDIPTGRKKM